MAPKDDPHDIPSLTWRIAEKFGIPAVALLAMVFVFGYVGRFAVLEIGVPMKNSTIDTMTEIKNQVISQSAIMGQLAKESKDTEQFRTATIEVHRSAQVMLQTIHESQVRLEEQNRRIIAELTTVGDGLRRLLMEPPRPTTPPLDSKSNG